MLNTTEELLKLARLQILSGNVSVKSETLVRCFFDELKWRQKRNVKRKSTNHYQDWLYYIAYDGRLARVPNTAKNPQGMRLLREKTIFKDGYGLLRAEKEIPQGQFVKIRPLLTELDPNNRWDEDLKDDIATYLDGGKQCSMVIDHDFETAYMPDYDEDFCLEGDLVSSYSCMSGQGEYAQEFYGAIEGCSVVRFENDEGEQVGRCIMYEYNGVRHFIRIYAYREYARCALRLLRAEMKEGDLFGRDESIPNMCLHTNWRNDTHTMYLDGSYYGVNINTNSVVNIRDLNWDLKFKETGNDELAEYYHDNHYEQCCYCGEWFNENDGVWTNDCLYCCDDCAESDGNRRCEHCGEWESGRDRGYEIDGCWYCCENCAEEEGWRRCNECGEWHGENEEMLEIDGDYYCNEHCAEKYGYVKCSKCGEYIKSWMSHKTSTGKWLCQSCAGDNGYELRYYKPRKTNKEVKND